VTALKAPRYGVAISWDNGGCAVDLDLQAIVVDVHGVIIDAVYYNNLKAGRAITHSGDETTGDKAGFDEMVWVQMDRVPTNVHMIIFVVAAHSGGCLRDASNANVHILEERKDCEIERLKVEESKLSVKPVLHFARGEGGWGMCEIGGNAVSGQHFVDILEPTLGNIIRGEIPGAPSRQKVAFAMQKGSVVDLPQSSSIGRISAGLGWDVSPAVLVDVDLDVSAVLFTGQGQLETAVFFGNLEECGLQHSGDNLTGEGDGDDEVITVDLEVIPPHITQIFFVVNVYTDGVNFGQVSNAYCRILDSSSNELARYVLSEGRGQRGLVISRLFRGSDNRWGFQALGSFCNGKTWKESVSDMMPLVQKKPLELQRRGNSVISFGEQDTGRSSPDLQRAVRSTSSASFQASPPETKSSACTVM